MVEEGVEQAAYVFLLVEDRYLADVVVAVVEHVYLVWVVFRPLLVLGTLGPLLCLLLGLVLEGQCRWDQGV